MQGLGFWVTGVDWVRAWGSALGLGLRVLGFRVEGSGVLPRFGGLGVGFRALGV